MDWAHTAIELAGGTIPILLYMWNNKRQAKQDAARRHEESQAVLNGLVTERRYFPAHKHKESKGPLTAECIEYPPTNGGIKP